MIKPIGQRKAYTFIINCNQYSELKEQLNKEKKNNKNYTNIYCW